uniref:Uncharacterized protein n=1 Tax=Marseillevirus LCMAC101 TaxID=2506602 RepID=A0A481YSJ7_9VIRU|nr:MAG: hypothetical protein LCMAC101_05450 [Marseillevirus LCMAC101]
MAGWVVRVTVHFDEKDSDFIKIIMSRLEKSETENVYLLKSKGVEYSTFATDKIISRIKWRFVNKKINCRIHVGSPELLT